MGGYVVPYNKHQFGTKPPLVFRDDGSGFVDYRQLCLGGSPTSPLPPTSLSSSSSQGRMSRRCRYTIAMVLCNAVLFFHLTFVVFLGSSDFTLGMQEFHDSSYDRRYKRTSGQLHLPRSKSSRNGVDKMREDTRFDPDPSNPEGCQAGHIQGLGATCDATGCLHKLMVTVSGSTNDRFPNAEISLEGSRLRDLLIIPVLTSVQFRNDVYGTVGLVAADDSEITEYIASQADTASGERIFRSTNACEEGINTKHKSHFINRAVVSYHGRVSELSKEFFIRAAIPQFRLIYVSDNGDAVSLSETLERATCLLRDGGLVVLQSGRTHSASHDAVRTFFTRSGSSVLSPLIITKHMSILCTTNLKTTYLQQILSDQIIRNKFSFVKESSDRFGYAHSYLLVT